MDARKQRFGAGDLDELFADASKVMAMKGKKVVTFDMRKAAPTAAELEKAVLGPSGNLRAPAIRMGKTFVVGFSQDGYEQVFG